MCRMLAAWLIGGWASMLSVALGKGFVPFFLPGFGTSAAQSKGILQTDAGVVGVW